MILTIALPAILIIIDQITKNWAVQELMPVGTMPLLPGIIGFRYIENTGSAFSLFANQQTFLTWFTAIILLGLFLFLLFKKPQSKVEYISLLFVFAGGAGNWIDRITRGFVVDFFDFQFMNFAVFNVADIFVTVGCGVFLISIIHSEIQEKKKKQLAESEEKSDKDDEEELQENDVDTTKIVEDKEEKSKDANGDT